MKNRFKGIDPVDRVPEDLGWRFVTLYNMVWGSPPGPVVKNLPAHAGDLRDTISIPGLERSAGVGNGNPLQYSCLKSSKDRIS